MLPRPRRPDIYHPSFIVHYLLVALAAAASARADDAKGQAWLVSTRDAPSCCDPNGGLQGIRFWQLGDDCSQTPADAKTFRATDNPDVPTVVFIHGNRTDADEAVWKARYAFERIRAHSDDRPFRCVIWSWPADQVYRRNDDDIRLKAARSDVESCYLARWLDGLQPGVKVSLIGHSFGPRIITGALHLLAGGEVAGQRMPDDTVSAWAAKKRNPVRAVLLAAAVDADWLAPGGCHGLALSLTDRMLITRNCCDRVLRWYPRLYGRGGPPGMGFVGPSGIEAPEIVEVIDTSATVGKIHDWRCYCSASNVCSRWAQYAFLEE